MSLKTPKKSDSSKPWMQHRKDRRISVQPEYHLIVSEGTKTEPNYFDGLKQEINSRARGKLDVRIEGEGSNTLSLLERAQIHVKQSINPIKHVWLVYDLDSFPLDNFDNTAFKCSALSKSVTYHALWSNQCIELWFLLHFAYHQEDIHRSEYKTKLDNCLNAMDSGDYEKNREDIYAILRPFLPNAIENAKRLKQLHDNLAPSKNAPGSSVYEIFEFLSGYMIL